MTGLFVALAGGVGAGLRFAVDGEVTQRAKVNLPVATLLINVVGSLLLGAVIASASSPLTAIAGTGFLGGFTTFSTASVEVVLLARERRRRAAVGFAIVMLVLALAAAWVGGALVTALRC